jgi:hypothetical protein
VTEEPSGGSRPRFRGAERAPVVGQNLIECLRDPRDAGDIRPPGRPTSQVTVQVTVKGLMQPPTGAIWASSVPTE